MKEFIKDFMKGLGGLRNCLIFVKGKSEQETAGADLDSGIAMGCITPTHPCSLLHWIAKKGLLHRPHEQMINKKNA